MEIPGVQSALLTRGTRLSPPANKIDLTRLAALGGEKTDNYIINIYSAFDGFENTDKNSQINLWPIDKIIQMKDLQRSFDGQRYFAFGDLMIDSDFIMWCPGNEKLPVYLLYEHRKMARSASDFLEMLGSGAFDFLGSGGSKGRT